MQLQPTEKQWRTLYHLAGEFQKLAPWEWMWDSDIFSIENPKNKERGYCCVMGRNGEHFAFAVYRGTEGLEGFDRVASGEYLAKHPLAALHVQRCLMVSFEDRGQLKKNDIDSIKNLGLHFHGKNVWPLFRSYEPGYVPWYLTADEAEFLAVAIEQALSVAPRVKENQKMLQKYDGEKFLTCKQTTKGEWSEQWLEPEPREVDLTVAQPVPEKISQVKSIPRQQQILEVSSFFAPAPVDDMARPYYPSVLLVVDHTSGFIMHTRVLEKKEPVHFRLPLEVVALMEKWNSRPRQILVDQQELFSALQHVGAHLDIKIELCDELPMADQAQQSMYEFFTRDKSARV